MRILSNRFALIASFVLISVCSAARARAQDEPPAAPPSPPPAAPLSMSTTTPPAGAGAAPADAAPPVSRDDNYEKAGGEHREVHGHRFITPTFDGYSALTNSSILFEQGFGGYLANFNVKTGIPGIGTVSPALFQYHQLLAGEIAILNRVAIDIRAKGTADIGSNTKNLLAYGVIGDVEAGGGPKVRLFTLDKVGLTASIGANFSYEHLISLSPVSVIEAIANRKSASKGVQQEDDYVISPLFMVAEGIGPFGVQVTVFPRILNGGFQQTDVFVDTHVTFDVQRITRYVPIALTFEIEPDVFLTDAAKDKSTVSTQIAGGIYYSGRRDFSFGGVFQFVSEKSAGQDANIYTGLMTMQYFF